MLVATQRFAILSKGERILAEQLDVARANNFDVVPMRTSVGAGAETQPAVAPSSGATGSVQPRTGAVTVTGALGNKPVPQPIVLAPSSTSVGGGRPRRPAASAPSVVQGVASAAPASAFEQNARVLYAMLRRQYLSKVERWRTAGSLGPPPAPHSTLSHYMRDSGAAVSDACDAPLWDELFSSAPPLRRYLVVRAREEGVPFEHVHGAISLGGAFCVLGAKCSGAAASSCNRMHALPYAYKYDRLRALTAQRHQAETELAGRIPAENPLADPSSWKALGGLPANERLLQRQVKNDMARSRMAPHPPRKATMQQSKPSGQSMQTKVGAPSGAVASASASRPAPGSALSSEHRQKKKKKKQPGRRTRARLARKSRPQPHDGVSVRASSAASLVHEQEQSRLGAAVVLQASASCASQAAAPAAAVALEAPSASSVQSVAVHSSGTRREKKRRYRARCKEARLARVAAANARSASVPAASAAPTVPSDDNCRVYVNADSASPQKFEEFVGDVPSAVPTPRVVQRLAPAEGYSPVIVVIEVEGEHDDTSVLVSITPFSERSAQGSPRTPSHDHPVASPVALFAASTLSDASQISPCSPVSASPCASTASWYAPSDPSFTPPPHTAAEDSVLLQ